MQSLTDLYEAYLRNAGGPSTSLLSLPLPVESARDVMNRFIPSFMTFITVTQPIKATASIAPSLVESYRSL